VLAAALTMLGACSQPVGSGPGAPTSAGSVAPTPTAERPTPSEPDPTPVTVAFVEATALEPPADRIAPAYQGAKLAFATAELRGELPAPVEIEVLDSGGTLAGTLEVAAGIVADPRTVAVIAAPGLPWQAVLGDALDAAGVPWVSLSTAGADLVRRGWSGWRALVPDQVAEGEALGRVLHGLHRARQGLCVLEQRGIPAGRLRDAAIRTAGVPVVLETLVEDSTGSVAAAASGVADRGCGAVLWTGEGALGAALRRRLVELGLGRTPFLGTERIRDAGYLEAAGAAAEGTLAVCPCADVSTSTRLVHQRFIQDYQAEFGLAPGSYAVEGWDAAELLISALRSGTSRAQVREALDDTDRFEGLAVTYRFGRGGELLQPVSAIHTYRVEGGRWLELSEQRRR
jgi:branched-chain amino acid transport system substrate-binding protein